MMLLSVFWISLLLSSSVAFLQKTPTTTNSLQKSRRCPWLLHPSTKLAAKSSNSARSNNKKQEERLNRPERKALQRAKKARRQLLQQSQNGGPPSLPSALTLSPQSSFDHVMKVAKRAQNLNNKKEAFTEITRLAKFLHEQDKDFTGKRGALLSRLSVAALHHDFQEIAYNAIQERKRVHRDSMEPMESMNILRGLLRVQNLTDALEILDEELSLPPPDSDLQTEANRERLKCRAQALASMASRHFFQGEPLLALRTCQWIADMGNMVRQAGLTPDSIGMPWRRIVLGAAQCEACRRNGTLAEGVSDGGNIVYGVLNAMTAFPSGNDDSVYEALSNALVRRVVFVTGATNLDTCPPPDRGEAAFIGRSNVGKSSLVNMITNRKSLAHTSKTPGKTQQFNYFAVNDKPSLEREIRFGDVIEGETRDHDAFYIVDLPGFGFAKVPEQVRREWQWFMRDYLTSRSSLKVIFHLIDARHGPTEEDIRIMQQVGEILPTSKSSNGPKYVVVLTKADKNCKGSSSKRGKVPRAVLRHVVTTLETNRLKGTPIVLSSAETKMGRDDLWRFLSLAAQ